MVLRKYDMLALNGDELLLVKFSKTWCCGDIPTNLL